VSAGVVAGGRRKRVPDALAGVPVVVLTGIVGAWALAFAAEATGRALVGQAITSEGGSASLGSDSAVSFLCPLHLSALPAGSGGQMPGDPTHAISFWLAFALFLAAWQAMIAAMMLPSSLPLIRLFSVASAGAPARGRAIAAFLGGYALVWTAFGAVAFAADALLHRLIDQTAGLRAHQWVIVAALLALAGAVQFTPLKDRCLSQCRHPGAFLIRHYRRGTSSAFALGRRHGLFCLGCCWALMLVMFVAGTASLIWMAALTALMVYEKTARHGNQVVPLTGIALLAWATLVLVHPAGMPVLLRGGV
jgi:predicted metal-binding membrane protein